MMKIVCSWAKKDYGTGPHVGVELEIDEALAADPQKLREQIRKLHAVCYDEVEHQLALHPLAPAVREAGDDDDARPGDPAYERSRGPSRADDRGSYGSDDDYDRQIEREHERHDRGRGDRRDARPPERGNDRGSRDLTTGRDDRGSGGRQGGGGAVRSGSPQGGRSYGPPKNTKMFCGWFQGLKDVNGGDDIRREVYRLLEAWELTKTVKDLHDDDAVAIYNEIMRVRSDNRNVNGSLGGNGNGRSNGNAERFSNGDGGRR